MRNYKRSFLFLLLATLCGCFAFSQAIYFPYYGKNKVIYEKFDWKYYKTDHYDIYYNTDNIQDLKKLSSLAESAYQKISNKIKHQLSAPIPLIFYRTFTDFEQTNLFSVPEGVLGAAEPLLYRVIIHADMPQDELQDLVEHELTHIFEYDLLWENPGGALYASSQPPGWIMEGFAEYNTEAWSPWSSLIVRDAVLNDRIPELTVSGQLFSRYPLPRPPDYDFGHALYEFIEHRYGKNGIREFWSVMKGSSLMGRFAPLKRAFNQTTKEFNHEFKKYIRAKLKKFLTRENPEDYSIPIGPEFPLNPYYFAFSHAPSPSGDIVAVLLASIKDSDLDIILFSTKDGKLIKNITKGYTSKYEHIKYEIDPSKGKDICWSSDGDQIAFFARAGQKHSLFIIDALTGKTLKSIKIPMDQPASPSFFPGANELLFTAFEDGIHNIFKINLTTEKILHITDDDYFEKACTISPDGKYMAYTIRVDSYDKLFFSPLDSLKKKTQLTFGRGNTISPEFSPDSKKIYFSGDMRDAFNIYSLNLETGELKRYTDVRTGNFFPVPLQNDPNKLIFSSFNKGSFQVFKSELKGEVEKSITFVEKEPEEEFKQFEPILTVEIDKDKIKSFKGLGKLYLTARPPVDAIFSTDGSIYGGSSLSFTDLFGDHTIMLMAYQARSFRSYYFTYLNQKRRLQYMTSAYQYTMFYYPPYAYYDRSFYRSYSYNDAISTRTISGVQFTAYYPLNKFYRTQAGMSYSHYSEDFLDPYSFGGSGFSQRFLNGSALSLSLSLTGETTRFNYYGPSSGNTFHLSFNQSLPVHKSFIQNTTVQADLRQYLHIGGDTLLAFRFFGFASRGKNPYIFYFGGNNEVRSENYYGMIGNEGWYANIEFRFPLVNIATTLLGQLGPIRGTFFFDVSRSKIKGFPAKLYRYSYDLGGRLIAFDAVGSYGYGLEFFILGLPLHLEFVKRIEISDISNPFKMNVIGDFMTKFWIGFDF